MLEIKPQISYSGSSVFNSTGIVQNPTALDIHNPTNKESQPKISKPASNSANTILNTLGKLRISYLLDEKAQLSSNVASFQEVLSTNSEFKNLIWMKLGDNDQERYQALSKIYQEHGFIGPLDLLEKATQQRLENLNCPLAIKQKVTELFKILNSKTHNLSGYLPKAYSLAAIQSVEIYKHIIQNSESSKHPKDLQIFFGDYSNLGNTNKHLAEITKTLLRKSLDLNHHDGQKMQIGIQNRPDEEKEAVIKSLEEILFYSNLQGKPLIIAKDWDILKKIIRQKPAPPFAERHSSPPLYNNPRYVNKILGSIAEQAGKRLTDMTGVLIATQVKKSLENFSNTNVIACGQGGDEISGIIPNPNIDPVTLANTINKETAQLCYLLGLNHHAHGKYLEAIFNGLGLGLAIDLSENLKNLGGQINDSNPCSTLEKAYLSQSKEAAKILSGCVIPFNIEGLLSKYTAQIIDEQGLPKENPFTGSNSPEQIEIIRQKLQNLKDLYTRNDKNPELTGQRYIQHLKGELKIEHFLADLEFHLDLQGQIIMGDHDCPVVGNIYDFDIIKNIAQRLLIRSRIALIESENYQRSDEAQSLIAAKKKDELTTDIIGNYLITLQARYKNCVPSETSQAKNSLFPPIEITSPSDPNRRLLFTTQVDRDSAALKFWLKTNLPETNPVNKSQIENIIAPLIQLQEEQDPVTQTPAGSNLIKMIELYGEDIQIMNRLYPPKPLQPRTSALKDQVEYPNEPLALALNVLNLAAFNKHLSVNYADQFLQIISKKLTEILKEQGFPNAEKLIFHTGGAKFILLLPPYINNSEEQEVFYNGAELLEKAQNIQKQFFEYIKNLNGLKIGEFIQINNPENLSGNQIEAFFQSVTKILKTDIQDLLSFKKLDSDKSNEPETPFKTIGELISPKGGIKGTHLATGATHFIRTGLHDAASTLASLNADVDKAEKRIKLKLAKESYA
jgi:GGDEF domain-containing protein